MMAIKGVYREGRIDFAPPSDWPEGCEVVIEPTAVSSDCAMREADWPTTPEAIAALVDRWDRLEPLEMTPEEEQRLIEADLDCRTE